ncbi:MAG: hypothetical protein PHI84_14770 [Kiritimatiellae bacterium]|nr:hypothetical protein [Kiritimatiellia bacterium]
MRAKYTLISICGMVAMGMFALCAGGEHSRSRPLVGAIRWDAWYGSLPASVRLPDPALRPGFDTGRKIPSADPGKEAQRALSPETWRYRWPFFTVLNTDGSAKEINGNLTGVVEQEIEYAVHAGLDYWAFDAYPEDCPLSYTLKTFLSCRNRDKIKFCLFLVMSSAYGGFAEDNVFQAYALRMITQPNYLKVQGNRPVIYMGFLNDRLVELLSDGRWKIFCSELEKRGLGKPYLVMCHGSPTSAKRYYDILQGDAVSQYNVVDGKMKGGSFSELATYVETFWDKWAATGVPVIPICVTGWDRRTRVTNPVSWETFHLKKDAFDLYYKSGTPEEIAAHIGKGVSWFNKHPGVNGNELVLIYAWNEIDEGGWLVPVLPPPHGEGTARIDALRKVLVTP